MDHLLIYHHGLEEIIGNNSNFTKISFIGHSIGGLIIMYAMGLLYRENKIAGLIPINFITYVCPYNGIKHADILKSWLIFTSDNFDMWVTSIGSSLSSISTTVIHVKYEDIWAQINSPYNKEIVRLLLTKLIS